MLCVTIWWSPDIPWLCLSVPWSSQVHTIYNVAYCPVFQRTNWFFPFCRLWPRPTSSFPLALHQVSLGCPRNTSDWVFHTRTSLTRTPGSDYTSDPIFSLPAPQGLYLWKTPSGSSSVAEQRDTEGVQSNSVQLHAPPQQSPHDMSTVKITRRAWPCSGWDVIRQVITGMFVWLVFARSCPSRTMLPVTQQHLA